MKDITFTKKLLELIKKSGKSQQKIAEELDIPSSTLYSWTRGENFPRIDKLEMLAEYFNISKAELLEESELIKLPKLTFMTKTLKILGSIPAGEPIEAVENILGEVKVPDEYSNDKRYFALRISGDSMDKVLPDNFIAVFEKCYEAPSGSIVACFVNGYDATVKRYYNREDKIILEPESHNEEHQTHVYIKNKTRVQVIGKLVWACSSEF